MTKDNYWQQQQMPFNWAFTHILYRKKQSTEYNALSHLGCNPKESACCEKHWR